MNYQLQKKLYNNYLLADVIRTWETVNRPLTVIDEFMNYFAQFGEIKEGRLVRDKLTRFGFITFASNDTTNEVMKKKHEIRGKNVQLKVAISKEQTRLKLLDEKLRKLFIMNIDRAMKKSQFQKYFIKYGAIDQVKVVHEHRKNGQEKNYAFVLFKSKNSMEKVFKDGEIHNVDGFKIECKPTLLRDELKQIHLDKLKKDVGGKRDDDNRRKKKKKKKKRADKKDNSKSAKKPREFKRKNNHQEEKAPVANQYIKKITASGKKKINNQFYPDDIESCWNAESSGFQSNFNPPSILEQKSKIMVAPKTWARDPTQILSNRASLDGSQLGAQIPAKSNTPFDQGESTEEKKRKSMGGATRPSESLIPDEETPKQQINQSNPFANTQSDQSSLNFSSENPFTPKNFDLRGLNHQSHSFYPPQYEQRGHQNNLNMFNYYPKDPLSNAFNQQPAQQEQPPNSSFIDPQHQPEPKNEGNNLLNAQEAPEDERYRRRGNAVLWQSDLVDSVNKYAAGMNEPAPKSNAAGTQNRGNTGYSKQESAHPGFNMYRMLPYETKSEMLGRPTNFSGMTYVDRSQSDVNRVNYGMTGLNGFNYVGGMNTNFIPGQAQYTQYRTTDQSLAAHKPSNLGIVGPQAEMQRKTTSDFYKANKDPRVHYPKGRLTDHTALQAKDISQTNAHYEQYVLGFRIIQEGKEDLEEEPEDEDNAEFEDEFSDDSQDDGYNPKTKRKSCWGILGSTNNQNDEIY